MRYAFLAVSGVVGGFLVLALGSRASAALITGGTATQSSMYQGGTLYGASNAIDGVFNDFSHTDSPDRNATLTYDLPGTIDYTIDQVTLLNRDGCCAGRLRDITITVLAQDGTTPVFTSPLLNPGNVMGFGPNNSGAGSGSTAGTSDIVYNLPANIQGGLVRISRTADGDAATSTDDNNVLSLRELQVSGTLVPEPTSLGLLLAAPLGLMSRRRRV